MTESHAEAEDRPALLVLASTYPRWAGDVEPAFVHELSRRLTDDYAVTALVPRAPGAADREVLDGVEVIRYGYAPRPWETLASGGGGIVARLKARPLHYLLLPLFFLGQLRATYRLLRTRRFRVIHAHWLIPQGLIGLLACRLARCTPPLVCTSHGGDLYGLQGPPWRALKRWVLRRAAAVTVVSHAMQTPVQTLCPERPKPEVAPMGVDLRHRFVPPEASTAKERQHLLFVGRLVEKKGLDVLLDALARITAQGHYPDLRLTVAGGGPLEGALREQAEALGIAHRVTFKGMVPQDALVPLYQRAALFVAPFVVAADGDQEGLGLVLVEAAGCGCAIVTTDIPAVWDAIDESCATVVPPRDPHALAEALRRLLDDPEAVARMGQAGADGVRERFDWETVACRYRDILHNA